MKILLPILICLLHLSSLSQKPVIFLDFDGQTVDGTSWNTNGPIVAGPSSFNSSEIDEIIRRVEEDYSIFDVIVTSDSTKYFEAPPTKRMRCIITNSYEWYGMVGGVSYTGSFVWGDGTPCWVFGVLLGNNVKYVAEACSHEVGHTLGLRHQALYDSTGTKITDYNSGVGSGEIGWAPIMGEGYYRNVTTWYNGPNSFGSTSYQDDIAMILKDLTLKDDDYKVVTPINVNSLTKGIINSSSDIDSFLIVVNQSENISVSLIPNSVRIDNEGANMGMEFNLYDANKNLILTCAPDTVLNATKNVITSPGKYYITVQSRGTKYAPQYGMSGRYSLSLLQLQLLPLKMSKPRIRQIDDETIEVSIDIYEEVDIKNYVIQLSKDGRTWVTKSLEFPTSIKPNKTYKWNVKL